MSNVSSMNAAQINDPKLEGLLIYVHILEIEKNILEYNKI